MARIYGVDLPENKKVEVALTYVYGIGSATAKNVCKTLKFDPAMKVKELTTTQVQQITKELEGKPIEGDLRKYIHDNIQRLRSIGAYRGLRHNMGLPVRGQRTKTNARTRKGKRKTVGSMTKEMRAKLETASAGK